MGHNVLSHLTLAAILFAISIIVFDGAGIYTATATTAAEVSGNLMTSSGDYGADAERLTGLLPNIMAVIINIVLYYGAATILLLLFGLFKKKK